MAVLSDQKRQEIWAQIMRDLSDAREPIAITKAPLRAVVNTMDQWAQDNSASLRSAVNAAGGTSLTNAQVARIFARIVLERWTEGA